MHISWGKNFYHFPLPPPPPLAPLQIAGIKVVVANMGCRVIDRAIQIFGGAGVSNDVPLASWYAGVRSLRIADGPDIVHLETVAKEELKHQSKL